MRKGRVNVNRLVELLALWKDLSPTAQELIFSYLIGATDALENDKRYEDLKKEIIFTGTLSL